MHADIQKKIKLRRCAVVYGIGGVLIFIIGVTVGKTTVKIPMYLDRAARVHALVDELVKSPEHQQRALDEIAKDGDSAYVYLLQHLDDTRALSSIYVRYFSTHPKRPEQYSLIRSKTVGEAMLRYLCWSTESCEFGYDEKDKVSQSAQRRKVETFIAERWLDPSKY